MEKKKIPDMTGTWYTEHCYDDEFYGKFKVNGMMSGVLQSKFQKVQFLDLGVVGKSLILDGMIQSCELDEFIYHEMLVHPAMLLHPNPKRVYIGGGGEGGTAREVLKHKSLEKCVMVDIDGLCVDLCKKYIPKHSNGAFENPKLELIIDDAKKQLELAKDGEYDVIILDLADPQEGGPCYQLYTKEFYEMCKRKLSEDGVLVTQSTNADFYQAKQCYTKIYRTFVEVFGKDLVKPYTIPIPSFIGDWGFNIGLKSDKYAKLFENPKVVDELIEKRLINGEKSLECYDGETHATSFSLLKPLRKLLKEEDVFITKDKVVFFH